MGRTKPGTVKQTGAAAGAVLVGIAEDPGNRGLRVRVRDPQPSGEGGDIVGAFDLLSAGTGQYALYLKGHENSAFKSADYLLVRVQSVGGDARDCTHILKRNKLRVE